MLSTTVPPHMLLSSSAVTCIKFNLCHFMLRFFLIFGEHTLLLSLLLSALN